jgi:hypothetical protein
MVKQVILLAAALVLVATISGDVAQAQIVYGKPASVGTRIVYNHWNVSDESVGIRISQAVAPVTAFFPIRDNLEALLYVAGSVNDVRRSNTTSSLSGASDVRVQINQSLFEDHIVIGGGMNLPVGSRRLDYAVDTAIINMLSENFLSFPMRRFGQGFGVSAMIGGATMLGSFKAGLGLSYEYTGEYFPYEGIGEYDPGNVVNITAGIDKSSSRSVFFADLIVTLYSDDSFEGRKSFKQSPQVAIRVGSVKRTGSFRTDWTLRYLRRGRNTEYNPQEEINRQLQLFGNEFSAAGSMRSYFRPGWYVSPSVGVKFISADENGQDASRIANIGTSIGRNFRKGLSMSVGAKYFVGEVDETRIYINGYQVSMGLTASF